MLALVLGTRSPHAFGAKGGRRQLLCLARHHACYSVLGARRKESYHERDAVAPVVRTIS
jgi:hypothetical protein